MSTWRSILYEHEARLDGETKASTTIGGESIDLEQPRTVQQLENSILGGQVHGVPRGKDAFQARQLGETWAMEIIKNAINDQLAGAELGLSTPGEDDPDEASQALWDLLRDVLSGPHLQDDDWNDIVSAGVSDMVDVGHGYWEPIPTADGTLPVAALKPVDALTVRHNVTERGDFGEPAFYQAPLHTLGGSVITVGSEDLEPLERDALVTMRYPGSNRSNRIYPRAPGMQVQAALEHLTHSTLHSTRYYNENEVPAGFLQLMQADDQTIADVQESIKNSVGDPRSVEVIGGEGPANWVEMGGTAINLNIIEEQKWFLQLCLAAFGLTKGEISLTEDVNRNTADAELSIVHKRVTQGFLRTLEDAITNQVFRRFESYRTLSDEQQFDLKLTHSDPRQERAREEHLRKRWESGTLTFNEYRQMLGEEPDETTVELGGTELDYGDLPKFILEQVIRDARAAQGPTPGGGEPEEEPADEPEEPPEEEPDEEPEENPDEDIDEDEDEDTEEDTE